LHDAAERHLAGEVFRRGQQQRHHGHECAAAIGDPGQTAALADHRKPAPDEAIIGLRHGAALAGLGTGERDRLAMVADAHQGEPQPRLALVARRDQARQAAPDDADEEGDEHGIDDRRQHHIGGDRDPTAACRDLQRAADFPEDLDEGDDGDDRREQADGEIDHRLGRPADIVGDAVFGIGRLVAGEAEPEEAALIDPAIGQLARDPLPPVHLESLAGDEDDDAEPGRDQNQHRKDRHRNQRALAVLLLERVEEPAVPAIDGDIGENRENDRNCEQERPEPGAAGARAPPEATGQPCETPGDLPVTRQSSQPLHVVRTRQQRRTPQTTQPDRPAASEP
jgi:hypothetical protein